MEILLLGLRTTFGNCGSCLVNFAYICLKNHSKEGSVRNKDFLKSNELTKHIGDCPQHRVSSVTSNDPSCLFNVDYNLFNFHRYRHVN